MAVARVVDDIAVTCYTVQGHCKRRGMVGTPGIVAHQAISLQDEVIAMAAHAVVTFLPRYRIYGVELGVGDNIQTRDDAVVQTVVAVWNSAVMTNTAVRLRQRIKAGVKHTNVLVDRRGWDICPAADGEQQRHAGEQKYGNHRSLHFSLPFVDQLD
jgi:hypothetical protein